MSEPSNLYLYGSLMQVLRDAADQAADGKGAERHVVNEEPFEQQLICWLNRRGYDFCRGQAVKKIDESLRLPPDRAVRELLGAINYLAAAVIVLNERAEHATSQ